MYQAWMKRGQVKAKRDPKEKKEPKEGGDAAEATGDAGSNMMEELKAKSAFYQQVEAQSKEYAPTLAKLGQIVTKIQPKTEAELREFAQARPSP